MSGSPIPLVVIPSSVGPAPAPLSEPVLVAETEPKADLEQAV
eukprot:CAMPEP_0184339514 /NCGR_PEP_ID=MMETSP1089-20130417/8173_1 /TAXON_ID=38269 ORGANISM="Gloeochaete wittrockiana, Strain SAG46.84" /NCGR_SAMPLE_ID=MMETSP1089 /ASSEMBLY_ACC=CAM_ASM_000445 /LENGTH=41 /DNA_ID= /DNA_START= /DNA_END= /DNA_ORIENTATION=